MGTGLPLLPRSAGMYTPGVPQVDLPRMPMVDKARAAGQKPKYTERMQDLLDYARAEANALEPALASVSLSDAIAEASSLVTSLAA